MFCLFYVVDLVYFFEEILVKYDSDLAKVFHVSLREAAFIRNWAPSAFLLRNLCQGDGYRRLHVTFHLSDLRRVVLWVLEVVNFLLNLVYVSWLPLYEFWRSVIMEIILTLKKGSGWSFDLGSKRIQKVIVFNYWWVRQLSGMPSNTFWDKWILPNQITIKLFLVIEVLSVIWLLVAHVIEVVINVILFYSWGARSLLRGFLIRIYKEILRLMIFVLHF